MAELAELRKNAARANVLLKAMANKWRLVILCHLVEGEKSVGELEAHLGLSQSALSQHLGILRRDKLVKIRRASQTIFYSLASTEATAMMAVLYDVFCRDVDGRHPPGVPSAPADLT
jgi:DNA-binding transcriptional ArsR family regulator